MKSWIRMARRRGWISPVTHKFWEFQTWNSETVLVKDVRKSWIAHSLSFVALDHFLQQSHHAEKSFLIQSEQFVPPITSYMGNPSLIFKSVIFPADSAQKYISDNYMNEFLCAGHSHLVRRRPSWLVVVLDWRYVKVRAAADSFIHSLSLWNVWCQWLCSPWALAK